MGDDGGQPNTDAKTEQHGGEHARGQTCLNAGKYGEAGD